VKKRPFVKFLHPGILCFVHIAQRKKYFFNFFRYFFKKVLTNGFRYDIFKVQGAREQLKSVTEGGTVKADLKPLHQIQEQEEYADAESRGTFPFSHLP